MPAPSLSTPRSTYLSEMMQRLGIDPAEGAIPRLSMLYITAFHRCESCADKDACREWLDTMPNFLQSAPSFCPNDDILFELRGSKPGSSIAARDRHAHVADLQCFADEINNLLLTVASEPLRHELRCRRARLRNQLEWLRRKSNERVPRV